jgi:hypothetical protein
MIGVKAIEKNDKEGILFYVKTDNSMVYVQIILSPTLISRI